MGFDLVVWFEPTAVSVEYADRLYRSLGAESPVELTAHPAVTAFYEELAVRYPEFDRLTDDDVERAPWAAAHRLADTHVLMSIRLSRSDEVGRHVRDLAAAHGLVCFDPQERRVHQPTWNPAVVDQ